MALKENIFWVKCPKCGGKFYADKELRHNKEYKLRCPFCQNRFFDSESPEIFE
jgi:predicted nucleic-acid-binding Zn-ribbon protein